MPALNRQGDELCAQAFVDEKLHAGRRRATLCSEISRRSGEVA
jgi:hypothetical protein